MIQLIKYTVIFTLELDLWFPVPITPLLCHWFKSFMYNSLYFALYFFTVLPSVHSKSLGVILTNSWMTNLKYIEATHGNLFWGWFVMKCPKHFWSFSSLLLITTCPFRQGKRERVQIQSCIKYDGVYSDNISQLSFLCSLLNPSFPRYFVVLAIIYGAITFLSC